MIETPGGVDLDTIAENTFRHFPADFGVTLAPTDRLHRREPGTPETKADDKVAADANPSSARAVPMISNPYRRPGEIGFVMEVTAGRNAPLAGVRRLLRPPNAMTRAIGSVVRAASRIRHTESAGSSTTSETGVLGPEYHTERLYLDLPPFGFAWDRFTPATVLDLGCGLGGYLGLFAALGARVVVGVDGFEPTPHYLGGGGYIRHDLRRALDLDSSFDLVVCTEVVEHLDAEYGDVLIDSIARHARETILFSAARPGQPGEGHVNCRPTEHWINEWARRGWEPTVFDSLAIRSLSSYHWFRRNFLVLQPAGTGQKPGFSIGDLACLECTHVAWTDQEAGICRYSLARGLPPRVDGVTRHHRTPG